MSDERYEAFLKPKGGLEKSKALDVKYKIQRITEIMEVMVTSDWAIPSSLP